MVELHPLLHIEGVPTYVTYSWLAMALLITLSLFVRATLKTIPTGLQNLVEAVVEAIYNFCKESLGDEWVDTFFPFLGSLVLYILVCNFFGLIPGFEAPTVNINTTASCAVPVFILTHYYGLKVHKAAYIKHFLGPVRTIYAVPLMVLMFFIEVVSHIARPLTLSIRLFGNMLAKHYLLSVGLSLMPALLPIAILGLGVMVSLVQSIVFMLLATIYFLGAVEDSH
ncbi:ATP synthase F0, A subunit [Candidatus Magnetoovum chiemensis]|nr:ATP synthase F0, A subunit [Candidatus Magnetoovum chiemensis]